MSVAYWPYLQSISLSFSSFSLLRSVIIYRKLGYMSLFALQYGVISYCISRTGSFPETVRYPCREGLAICCTIQEGRCALPVNSVERVPCVRKSSHHINLLSKHSPFSEAWSGTSPFRIPFHLRPLYRAHCVKKSPISSVILVPCTKQCTEQYLFTYYWISN